MNRWYKGRQTMPCIYYGGRITPYSLSLKSFCVYLILSCFFLQDDGMTLRKFLNE